MFRGPTVFSQLMRFVPWVAFSRIVARYRGDQRRSWHICEQLALRLIARARPLYADEDLGLDLEEAVYALDSSTVDLCLSVFGWGKRSSRP